MKYALIFFILCSVTAGAQDLLTFNQKLIDCEDKWIALPMNKDTTYTFGFVYIDKVAGLTLDVAGNFKIVAGGNYKANKITNSAVKHRIPPTNISVAVIPSTKLVQLQVQAIPDWLATYKNVSEDVTYYFNQGFMYNQWNEAKKALTYLEKAKKINPNYNGLAFEFAFAYNVLKDYEKAIEVLKLALKSNPSDCLLYKELVYAQLENKLTDAEATFKDADGKCLSKEYKGEMAHNIAYRYYLLKNKTRFNYWAEEVSKNTNPSDVYAKKLKLMQAEIDKL
ncbi:tetratricopeptide repeat protein [Pedobacter mendelii]|uniref:Tetratricopeptide repeat protein n=1 Tax=Pedobacter mendelii TaxID=1908240 RepID=A0ABQ2BKK8_9SPHI|nr:tetratricopeptide repeat protein [Pedobacter mendelii]GGI26843.1 hypothetical protein GCM10008119_24690 [Pedobacter mendelii]